MSTGLGIPMELLKILWKLYVLFSLLSMTPLGNAKNCRIIEVSSSH